GGATLGVATRFGGRRRTAQPADTSRGRALVAIRERWGGAPGHALEGSDATRYAACCPRLLPGKVDRGGRRESLAGGRSRARRRIHVRRRFRCPRRRPESPCLCKE